MADTAPRRKDGKKIALLADHLVVTGGAEQVFLYMAQEFREADVFTLTYNPDRTWPQLRELKIRTSWANWFFNTHQRFKLLYFPATLVMQFWKLGDYDLIVSSCASSAKHIDAGKSKHLLYCYFPTRALWNDGAYFQGGGLVHRAFKLLQPLLRKRDRAAGRKVDRFIAISETTQREIRKVYGRESTMLFSPVPVDRFREGLKEEKRDFFLLVSRLEHWKRVDYAIEAFNRLGLPLLIVGVGEDEEKLKAMAKDNITFLGRLSFEEVIRLYGQARAAVFTPALEYGLVPMEANAAGTPAIALRFGGVKETMIGVEEAAAQGVSPTAVLFDEQTPEALIAAVETFQTMSFDRDALSRYADKFSVETFQREMRVAVERMLEDDAG